MQVLLQRDLLVIADLLPSTPEVIDQLAPSLPAATQGLISKSERAAEVGKAIRPLNDGFWVVHVITRSPASPRARHSGRDGAEDAACWRAYCRLEAVLPSPSPLILWPPTCAVIASPFPRRPLRL